MGRSAPSYRSAFSLVELLVVMAVVVMLTGLLMPAMKQLHENTHRIICGTNMKQIGMAMASYGHEFNDYLPYSSLLHSGNHPQNLMVAWRGAANPQHARWDGLGALFDLNYCGCVESFYCPSHHGAHPFDLYAGSWDHPHPSQTIYSNYHYAGDIDWLSGKRRSMLEGHELVLATDGLRTAKDFNHVSGMNVLRGDISVRWRDDNQNILSQLPRDEYESPQQSYNGIWDTVEDLD